MTVLARLGHRLVAKGLVNLARLKWFAIVLPVAALVVLVILLRSSLHDWLHEFPGVIFLGAAFGVAVFAFASVVFALFEDLEARIIQQNRELAELVTRTDRQNAELSALLTVGRASASSPELSQMLDQALAVILGVTSADAAELWLAEGGMLTLRRSGGVGAGSLAPRPSLRIGEGLPGAAAHSRSPVLAHDGGSGRRIDDEDVATLGLQTFLAIPLGHGAETVGVLAVAARDTDAFSDPQERRLLEGIGEQVALAIENSQLQARVLDRAVLEERERIARELHDGLAQVLAYINTQTLAVKKLVESERIREATSELEAMGVISREVYGDVREAIVGLRTAPKGLVPTIREYLSRLPRATGCEMELRVTGGAGDVALAPANEIQLVRIVQEALSNVRKHAGASHVDVIVEMNGDELGLEIVDDGHGFDPQLLDRTGWPRLGLQTMRERAQAIGGAFEVRSVPGQGTSVTVRVPLSEAREDVDARRSR